MALPDLGMLNSIWRGRFIAKLLGAGACALGEEVCLAELRASFVELFYEWNKGNVVLEF